MSRISIVLNGERVSADVEPRTHLADLLREGLRATGTHLGCEHGVCGSCTVLLDGVPVRACITLAVACDGREVRSIEGFAEDPVMADLRGAFTREHALQCGFCTPGMLIAARDIVLRLPDADEPRIRRELAGNLCRCTGYLGIVRAVESVIEGRRNGASVLVPPAASQVPALTGPGPVASPLAAASGPAAEMLDASAVAAGGERTTGWTTFDESFVIRLAPDAAWQILKDVPAVAACVPGAELLEQDDARLRGRMTLRVGPINAAFTGTAVIARDDATRTGTIRGAGTDSGSKSRTTAVATYRVAPEGSDASRVSLHVAYSLQGPLAQFSRSSLAQEIGRRLIAQFADNLDARLADKPQPDASGASLDLTALLWSALRARIARLWSALTGR